MDMPSFQSVFSAYSLPSFTRLADLSAVLRDSTLVKDLGSMPHAPCSENQRGSADYWRGGQLSTQLISQRIDRSFFDKQDDTVITWLGSAGALINARGTILFIDPLITLVGREGKQVAETGHRLKVSLPIEAKQVPRADAVLYTHADGDHFGQRTAEMLDRRLKPMFIAPPPVRKAFV